MDLLTYSRYTSFKPVAPEIEIKSDLTKLKVRVKAVHTVDPGDILSKVSAKYGVGKSLIMAANGKTLIIPFP